MEILGGGLIARGLAPYQDRVGDALVFACGVSDSTTTDEAAYRRETDILQSTLARARSTDRRLVYFTGGGAIYGQFAGIRDERTQIRPVTRYGRHQAEAEARIRASGARHVIARLANLVGPGQNAAQLVPNLVRQAVAGRAQILRDASRDVLAVEDAARLVVELLETDVESATFVVARGRSTTVPELFRMIEELLGTRAAVNLVPAGDAQAFSVARLCMRLGRPEQSLGVEDLESALVRHVPAMAEAALARG